MSLATCKTSVQPINRLLGVEAAEVAYSCDLKNDDPIVVVDGPNIEKLLYHAAGAQRCLNDPERQKRPAKIYSGSKGRVDPLIVVS